MIIHNGTQVRLVIDGVFDGTAGLSRGVLAFIPNRSGRKPENARSGIMDGEAVRLSVSAQGGLYTATVRTFA